MYKLVSGFLLVLAYTSNLFAQQDRTPTLVRQLLETKCLLCHGGDKPRAGLAVLNHKLLVSSPKKFVVPGKPAESRLFKSIESGTMPEDGKLPDGEIELIRKWIEMGAPDFPATAPQSIERPFVDQLYVFRAMNDDLKANELTDRPFLRYFSFVNLHNDPSISDQQLRLFRAALSKAINSLTWVSDIVLPTPVDRHQVVLRIDLRDLEWDADGEKRKVSVWDRILSHYPYGLTYKNDRNRDLRTLANDVYQWTESDLPIIRADWFTANATVPPLYHTILGIPKYDYELEAKLGVDFKKDFLSERLRRAAFGSSGVSNSNRLVDRHRSLFGAYWKSYDFKSSEGKQDLTKNPLGPLFDSNPFKANAFDHDGGEIVFNLPNGMQGYMITDNKGLRIDSAPEKVVFDKNRATGQIAVVNGISCMVCHEYGVKDFSDTVRDGHAVIGQSQVKVERLYATDAEMKRLLAKDRIRFERAMDAATGKFLRINEDRGKPLSAFSEPIKALVAERYVKDMLLSTVLAELGFNPRNANNHIQQFQNGQLRKLGMNVLTQPNGTIKREAWDKLNSVSQFHKIAEALEIGTPFRMLSSD